MTNLEGAKQCQAQARPAGGQEIEVKGLAVKQMQESMVGVAMEVQDTHEASDAGVVAATTHAHQYENHP